MADDNDDNDNERRFSLSRIRKAVGSRSDEELEDGDDPDVKSRDDIARTEEGPMKPFTFQQEDYDRTEAPKDEMRTYWRQFETTPIIRKPITSFADQVTEPGYYIQARGVDEEELRDLDHWLQSCSIIEGETDKDFRLLIKKATIQREVRGTSLIEKAPSEEDPEKIAALKLINPETMEAITRPGQSILLAPEDIEEYEDAPEAESGGAAAYLQDLSETQTFFGTPVKKDTEFDDDEEFKIGFRRDEIIKLTRDADVGEIFGTSRIEAVSDRIEGIRQKLNDNDEAIASKAYPLWLFMFGTEDNPWDSDDINEFMKAHEMSNFHPGMKQGVRGDVSVDTISGEVAEIAEYLEFDLNWIMSAMPMPKFALGAFGGTVGQVGGIAQQQDVNRQIKESRREIEEEFTPLLREVAQQKGIDEDTAKDMYLKIGSPGEPEPEVPRRENIIRYVPKDQREPSNGQQTVDDGNVEGDGEGDGDGGDGEDRPPHEPEPVENPLEADTPGFDNEKDYPEKAGAQLWHTESNIAELQLEDGDNHSQLADLIYNTMIETRNKTLDKVGNQYGGTPTFAATNFERTANRVLRSQMGQNRLTGDIQSIVGSTVNEVEESLRGNSGHFSSNQNIRFFSQNIENSTEDAIEEMLRLMRIQTRRAVTNNENWDTVRQRVEERYSDANLRQRAELIASMELKNAKETTKLQNWETDPNVVGVRLRNDAPSTPLTQSLDGAEAMFGQGDLQEQWMNQTRKEFLRKGFDPIPATPPLHYNDTTTLEPIYDD